MFRPLWSNGNFSLSTMHYLPYFFEARINIFPCPLKINERHMTKLCLIWKIRYALDYLPKVRLSCSVHIADKKVGCQCCFWRRNWTVQIVMIWGTCRSPNVKVRSSWHRYRCYWWVDPVLCYRGIRTSWKHEIVSSKFTLIVSIAPLFRTVVS